MGAKEMGVKEMGGQSDIMGANKCEVQKDEGKLISVGEYMGCVARCE